MKLSWLRTQETEHDHVHCIVNLIHPETGKTFVPSYDRLALSKWAEERENIEGKIYCEERVKNNEKRREQGADLGLDKSIIKHREKKLDISETIQAFYEQSDSGKAFMAALKEGGFNLAKGDRRGFVLVDEQGKIHSLSRQLKGQRAKNIKQKLADLDINNLPSAQALSLRIKENIASKPDIRKPSSKQIDFNQSFKKNYPDLSSAQFLDFVDKERDLSDHAYSQKYKLKKMLDEFYGHQKDELRTKIKLMKIELERAGFTKDKQTAKQKNLQNQITDLEKSLRNIEARYSERYKADYNKIQSEYLKKRDELRESYNLPANDLDSRKRYKERRGREEIMT